MLMEIFLGFVVILAAAHFGKKKKPEPKKYGEISTFGSPSDDAGDALNKVPEPSYAPAAPVIHFTITTSYEVSPRVAPVEDDDGSPPKDAWEPWDDLYAPNQRSRPCKGVRLHIHFTDRDGQKTERDIECQHYSYNPDLKLGVLAAYCTMRQGNRPFAFSRISQAIDLDTGEFIADLPAYLDRKYEATALYTVESFLQDHGDAVYVMFSMAKADGVMRAKERAIIIEWAKAQGLHDPEALTELENQFRTWQPVKSEFWNAVKTVAGQQRPDGYIRGLWDAVVATAMCDKKLHDDEFKLLRYAAGKWSIPEAEVKSLQADQP